jgi:hypothetical protein
LCRKQPLATAHALRYLDGLKCVEAFGTNGKAGNREERGMAQPAIGGKEYCEKTAESGFEARYEGYTLLGALHSSFSR